MLLFSKFDIKYVTKKSVKWRAIAGHLSVKRKAIADHLAHYSPGEAKEVQGNFPYEDIIGIEVELWKMYFDRATNQNGSGIGVLLISPKGTHIPFSSRLNFPATEYKTCIIGLNATIGLGVKELEVYGDSALIISQIQNR